MTITDGGLRCDRGRHHPGAHWLGRLTEVDRRVLARVEGPVLDVGCGPGRHAAEVAARGTPALGIDITPGVLALARPRGVTVLRRDVFDRVPGEGRWGTVLLLDGNIGIGGDQRRLLARVAALLRPGGLVLVELERTETALHDRGGLLRVELEGAAGPWFAWRTVGPEDLDAAVAATRLAVEDRWTDERRRFSALRLAPS